MFSLFGAADNIPAIPRNVGFRYFFTVKMVLAITCLPFHLPCYGYGIRIHRILSSRYCRKSMRHELTYEICFDCHGITTETYQHVMLWDCFHLWQTLWHPDTLLFPEPLGPVTATSPFSKVYHCILKTK